MGHIERQKIYKSIVSMRKKPLIAYVTSIRPNLSGHMAGDAISPIIEQINKIPKSYNLCRAFNRSAVLLFRIHRFILAPKKSLEKKKANSVFVSEFVFFICGGAKGTRTPGLCVANASLYQLSYNPTRLRCVKPLLVELRGFEPLTF